MTREHFYGARANTDTHLRVTSIFLTVDGETNAFHTGTWSTFIRLQGCRVGCKWCDTKYTWPVDKLGTMMRPSEIADQVKLVSGGSRKVTITGGEPMEQWGQALSQLLLHLYEQDYDVSMETAGCDDLEPLLRVHPSVNLIVDYKMESAGQVRRTHLPSFRKLRYHDVVKFVCTEAELEDVRDAVLGLREEGCAARMVFSPVFPTEVLSVKTDTQLAAFIAEAKRVGLPALQCGLNLQQHKFIWPFTVRDEEESGETRNTPVGGL